MKVYLIVVWLLLLNSTYSALLPRLQPTETTFEFKQLFHSSTVRGKNVLLNKHCKKNIPFMFGTKKNICFQNKTALEIISGPAALKMNKHK